MSTFIIVYACEKLRLDYNVNNYAAFQKVQIKKTFKYYPYCYCICFTFTFIHLFSPFLNAFNVANSSWSQGHEMYNNICISGSLINFNLTIPCMYICFWINIFVILKFYRMIVISLSDCFTGKKDWRAWKKQAKTKRGKGNKGKEGANSKSQRGKRKSCRRG